MAKFKNPFTSRVVQPLEETPPPVPEMGWAQTTDDSPLLSEQQRQDAARREGTNVAAQLLEIQRQRPRAADQIPPHMRGRDLSKGLGG
jgi:hypothetical protein